MTCSGYYNTHRRTTFERVDADQEVLPGTQEANIDGALFYHAEAACNRGLPYLPYTENKQLNHQVL